MEPTTSLVTGNASLDHWLAILGAFVPLASAITSLINHRVRSYLDAGQAPARSLVAIGSALNFASVNVDKGLQLMRMLKQEQAASTPATVIDPSAAPVQNPGPATCPTCGRAL